MTDDWFACIAFVLLWSVLVFFMVWRCMTIRLKTASSSSWPMLLFWDAMYGYCLIGLCALGIHRTALWFFGVGLLFTGATLYVGMAERIVTTVK